jgi:hypothetical protein
MPLQINLLAEQQLEEEMRRKDPVKRGYWAAALVAVLALIWVFSLQMTLWVAKSTTARAKIELESREKKASQVRTNLITTGNVERKLQSLNELAVNRVLWAPVLDALQFCMVDNIQVLNLRVNQKYTVDPGVRANVRAGIKEVSASSREQIVLLINAKCYAAEDQIMLFKRNIQNHANFKSVFTNDNSVRMTPPSLRQQDPADPSRSFVTFSLECYYPEKVR